MDESRNNLQRGMLRDRAAARIESYTAARAILALAREVEDDDVFGMAAEMAYRFLFALFPMLLFLVTAIGFAGNLLGLHRLFDQLLIEVLPVLPSQIGAIIDRYV